MGIIQDQEITMLEERNLYKPRKLIIYDESRNRNPESVSAINLRHRKLCRKLYYV